MTRTPVRGVRMVTDRDVLVDKHPQLSAPHEIDDPVTGVLQGPALAAARSKRPTDERVGKLEAKHDKLDEKVDVIATQVSRMEGKLDTALSFIQTAATQKHITDREHISTRGKIVIAALTTLGVIVAAYARYS
jgi:hypothetical protein